MVGDLNTLALISLMAVVMIGMPHGALDGAVAMISGYAKTSGQIIKFSLGYIAIAAAVMVVWMILPVFSLTLFMLYSLIHFGLGDAGQSKGVTRLVQIVCHGGLVVVIIPLAHLDAVQPIFLLLTGQETGADLAAFWGLMLGLSGLFAASAIAYTLLAMLQPQLRRRWLEFAGLAGVMMIVPPLTGFALYFCLVHTPRHIHHVIRAVRQFLPDTKILKLTFIFTLLTWAAMAMAVLMLHQDAEIDAALLQVIFIGLAALTVPHMMLVDGAFRRRTTDDAEIKPIDPNVKASAQRKMS